MGTCIGLLIAGLLANCGLGCTASRGGSMGLFLLFVSPNVFLLLLFTYRPLVESVRLSLYDWDRLSPAKDWGGLEYYTDNFGDKNSRYVIRNTVVFTVATVASTLILGMALALLLNLKLSVPHAAICYRARTRIAGARP